MSGDYQRTLHGIGEDGADATTPDHAVLLFHAFNRGIFIAILYSIILSQFGWILVHFIQVPDIIGNECNNGYPRITSDYVGFLYLKIAPLFFALVGFAAGAIGGFSNIGIDESVGRHTARNTLNAIMIALWSVNLLLIINLFCYLFSKYLYGVVYTRWSLAEIVFRIAGVFSLGVMLGAIIGTPLMASLAQFSVAGIRPFLLVNRITVAVRSPGTRLLLRALLHTVVLASLTALAITAIIAICVIAVVIGVILAIINEGRKGHRQESKGHRSHGPPAGPILTDDTIGHKSIGLKVDHDGTVTEDVPFGGQRTDVRVDEDGRFMEEGLVGDRPTGWRVKDDGAIVEEGLTGIRDTGLKIKKD